MNKKYLLTATLAVIVFAGYAQPVKIKKVFADAGKQMTLMLAEIPAAKQGHADWVSPRTLEKGSLRMVPSRDWTSGFFPGILWMLYEYSGKASWKEQAIHYTKQLEQEKWNRGTHDMGFKLYCSYGLGYRLTGDTQMRAVLLQAARTLSTRFNPTAGVIRSWDHNRDKWDYPVIIDNMLNLELLFAATQLSGDSSFYRIAVSHANTTLRNHFRPDYSSYHVVSYDTITGAPVKKYTSGLCRCICLGTGPGLGYLRIYDVLPVYKRHCLSATGPAYRRFYAQTSAYAGRWCALLGL